MPKLKVQILSSKFINFNFDSVYLIALEVQGQTILHCKDLEYTKYEPIGQRCANIPRSCHEVLKSGGILNKQGFGQSPCGILVMTFAYQMERQWFESTARRMLLSQTGFETMNPVLPAKAVGPQPANVPLRNEV